MALLVGILVCYALSWGWEKLRNRIRLNDVVYNGEVISFSPPLIVYANAIEDETGKWYRTEAHIGRLTVPAMGRTRRSMLEDLSRSIAILWDNPRPLTTECQHDLRQRVMGYGRLGA